MWLCHMFSQMQMHYRASVVDKMKIEPAMISLADQNHRFIVMESCKSFSVFLKVEMDNKWSECWELTIKLKKW